MVQEQPERVVLAIIPARGGSKGIPNKNIAECAGWPLIYWTIRAAEESMYVTDILITSDSQEILDVAGRHSMFKKNTSYYLRPGYLAEDETQLEEVIGYELEKWRWRDGKADRKPDYIVLLQPTSPLRTGVDIDQLLENLIYGEDVDSVFSVVPTHPHIWKMTEIGRVYASYDPGRRENRQDMGALEENGAIYAFTMEHWSKERNRIGGKIGLFVMEEEHRFQVDSPLDLEICDFLLRRREDERS